jgi:hypothetical protein
MTKEGISRTFVALLVVFGAASVVHADMMPAARGPFHDPAHSICDSAEQPRIDLHEASQIFLGDIGTHLPPSVFGLHLPARTQQMGDSRAICVLEERASSFSLCLYALIGAGLFQSGHWIKRSSLAFVPEWYHLGGPSQIGRSMAISPDSLCSFEICCLQLQGEPEDLRLEFNSGRSEPLLPKSLFTPNTHASRGPPTV